GVTDASWTFQFELRSSNGQWVTVLERYPIAGGADPGACRQTARALMPAVQYLLARIVRHPGFPRLLNTTRRCASKRLGSFDISREDPLKIYTPPSYTTISI